MLSAILSESSGFELEELDHSSTFLELGFDSLFLIQMSQVIKNRTGVRVSFRQLIEETPTIDTLLAHLASSADLNAPATPAVPASAAPQTVETAPVETAPVKTTSVDTTAANTTAAEPAAAPTVAPQQAAPAPAEPLMTPPAAPPMQPISLQPATSQNGLESILTQQHQLMAMQLQLLQNQQQSGIAAATIAPATAAQPSAAPIALPSPTPAASVCEQPCEPQPAAAEQPAKPTTQSVEQPATSTLAPPSREATQKKIFDRFGPYKPVRRGDGMGLTAEQQQHLDSFIDRYTAKTAKSKTHSQNHRQHFADPRGVAGYRRVWKRMVYQICVERSKGSKLWDIDGNEYVDIAMGFGLNLFGQSPDFVTQAVHDQLDRGVEVGPQAPIAGDVAQLLCDFSRKDRATFCNTGSEAVMAALRLARTVTGKQKFVFFNKDYHGNFDEVLVRSNVIGGSRRTSPAAPGVPQSFADNALVYDYCTPEALAGIAANADDIAAVLVEPVQSADPFLRPADFLKELRRITAENDIALIMDEVITGFRASQGGAQEWFDVWGDMATYGKILGGGMPIGALAGSNKYMNALDGGAWRYDDDSEPGADMTFFAGTFVRHPLALAAAHQVLMRVKEEGPSLQENLTKRTTYLVETLNSFFEQQLLPIRVAQFTSLFRFMFPPDLEYADMLYFHLLERGVFTRGWGDNCFLSTEHSDADIEHVINAVKDSCLEIRRGGFFPEPVGGATPATPAPLNVADGNGAESIGAEKKKPARFPLTEAQLEIWLTSQMGDEASCSFNEPFTVNYQGALNTAHLASAIETVVQRHEAFRLKFDPDGQYQELTGTPRFEFSQRDLSAMSASRREAEMLAIGKDFSGTAFDLTSGMLCRFLLAKTSDDTHSLFISAHHIITDGWSWNVLLGEFGEVYSALCQNEQASLPAAGSYRDYVLGETTGAQPEAEEALNYWVQQYQQPPTPLDLPTDRPRPAVKTYTGGTMKYTFTPELYAALKRATSANRVSTFSLTLAAFKVLLARLSGQQDIVVTVPTAGQAMAENTSITGHCVNLLPVRSQIDTAAPFADVLAGIQSNLLDAYDHQQCTFGRIVRELQLPRDASRMPLVEVNFNIDPPPAAGNFHGLDLAIDQPLKQAVAFDLFFNLSDTGDSLRVFLDYNTRIFDEATMRRWATHFENLLLAIAENPQAMVEDLPLLSPAEATAVLEQSSAPRTSYPRATAVQQLFEQQAEATPNHEAVVSGSTRLTYAELNARVNQLSHQIQSLGGGPGTLTGVYLERSDAMVIAVLAILKAGGGCVPLDPKFPVDRLKMMAEDAELPLIISQQSLTEQPLSTAATTFCIDRDWSQVELQPTTAPAFEPAPGQTAYVIFTSGSTGRPKGVQIPHGALTNFVLSMQNAPGMNSSDTLAGITTLSFDIAMLELFLPLTTGARLCIANQDDILDGRRLAAFIEEHNVTFMQATPASWRLLIESGWEGKADLTVLSGGEVMSPGLAKALSDRCCQLWNGYGPTEATVYASLKHVTDVAVSNIPVGRPVANTSLYILDEKLRPAPVGVPGRLYVGGDCLSQGYIKQPELTRQKFIDCPFDSGAKIYDTGDQARYLASGDIEFLGRLDHQVKIRGFRIELDEIEHALQQHPGVTNAVVVARDTNANSVSGYDEKTLVAYIVATGAEPETNALRTALRKTLPEYMVPAAFVFLEKLPLTPNQKVDRKALPAPVLEPAAPGDGYLPPRDAVELQLAGIWGKVLRRPQVGLDDNFFESGGHSLSAARMMVELERVTGRRMPLATLLQAATLREFAEVFRQDDHNSEWSCLAPINPGGSRLPLFCIHAAHGNVLLYRDLAKRLGDDQPVYGLQAQGLDGRQTPIRSVEQMAARYVKEIRSIQPDGPYHLAGYCLGGSIAFEVAQQLHQQGQETALLALLDTNSYSFEPSTVTWMYTGYQQVVYHLRNFINSGVRGSAVFAARKFDELGRRISRKAAVAKSRMAYRLGLSSNAPLELLEHVNDHAAEVYKPQPYAGRVTVFKPCMAYTGYDDPSLGWGDGLAGSVEVIELPVFPAGMLLEPFAGILAGHIHERLEQSHERRTQQSAIRDNGSATTQRRDGNQLADGLDQAAVQKREAIQA